MNRVQPRSFGFALAVFLGAWHTLWAFLVWADAAQWLPDFVFRLRRITPPYRVTAFSPFAATGLVLITAAIGSEGFQAFGFEGWNGLWPRKEGD
jgi:hypothetical protein